MTEVKTLYSLLLYVQDVEQSLLFYRDLLRLKELPYGGRGPRILQAGSFLLLLEHMEDAVWPDPRAEPRAGGHALTFEVEDPDEWTGHLEEKAVPILEGPIDQIWGRVLFVRDPDGRTVALAKTTNPSAVP